MSKLILKDKTEYELESYTNQDNSMLLKVKDLAFSDVKKVFSAENTSTVQIISDMEEVVAELEGYVLGSKISYDSSTSVMEISLVQKSMEEQITDLKAKVEELQTQVNELSVNVSSLTTDEKAVAEKVAWAKFVYKSNVGERRAIYVVSKYWKISKWRI